MLAQADWVGALFLHFSWTVEWVRRSESRTTWYASSHTGYTGSYSYGWAPGVECSCCRLNWYARSSDAEPMFRPRLSASVSFGASATFRFRKFGSDVSSSLFVSTRVIFLPWAAWRKFAAPSYMSCYVLLWLILTCHRARRGLIWEPQVGERTCGHMLSALWVVAKVLSALHHASMPVDKLAFRRESILEAWVVAKSFT